MKVKTSGAVSEELLRTISAETVQSSRSAFIEEATWRYLHHRQREVRDRRELERINARADDPKLAELSVALKVALAIED